jgi:hypothetical protein
MLLVTATHLVSFGAWDRSVWLLDAGHQWSFSHILATLGFASGSVICGIGASSAVRHRGWWWTAGALMGVLLLDNLTRLHEQIPRWPLLYGPFLGCLCVAVVRVAAETEWSAVVRAGVVLLCCSLAIHVMGPETVQLIGWGGESWVAAVRVGLKEGTELAGWVLLVPALAQVTSQLRSRPLAPTSANQGRRSRLRRSEPAGTWTGDGPGDSPRPSPSSRAARRLRTGGAQPAHADGDCSR